MDLVLPGYCSKNIHVKPWILSMITIWDWKALAGSHQIGACVWFYFNVQQLLLYE